MAKITTINEALVALAKRIPFRMVTHMSCDTEHYLDYLNYDLNICCCITTPYRRGKPGKEKREFAINAKGATGYATMAELLAAHPEIATKAAKLYP